MTGLDQLFDGLPARLDANDVANLLNLNTRVVYAWLREGKIPGYKIGTTWIILSADLKATMEANSNQNPANRDAHAAEDGDSH